MKIHFVADLNRANNEQLLNILRQMTAYEPVHYTPKKLLDKENITVSETMELLIADLLSFSKGAVETVRLLTGADNITRLLVIHLYSNEKLVQRLLDAGADGYVTNTTSEQELQEAIRKISKGDTYIGNLT